VIAEVNVAERFDSLKTRLDVNVLLLSATSRMATLARNNLHQDYVHAMNDAHFMIVQLGKAYQLFEKLSRAPKNEVDIDL
jgi:hypothetical protein